MKELLRVNVFIGFSTVVPSNLTLEETMKKPRIQVGIGVQGVPSVGRYLKELPIGEVPCPLSTGSCIRGTFGHLPTGYEVS